jgi:hypothetical protein
MRVGVVDGAKGYARVVRPDNERKQDATLELQCEFEQRGDEQVSSGRVEYTASGPVIDLLLAAPRPKRLKALIPVIAQVFC